MDLVFLNQVLCSSAPFPPKTHNGVRRDAVKTCFTPVLSGEDISVIACLTH